MLPKYVNEKNNLLFCTYLDYATQYYKQLLKKVIKQKEGMYHNKQLKISQILHKKQNNILN